MVERLARSPRLAHLLQFMGERYLRGDTAHLREYEIATEVFGRSPEFDPSQDAIARVEAHRLRKKLKFYYETEGRYNPIRITIPPGAYTPVFTHVKRDANGLTLETEKASPTQEAEPLAPVGPIHIRSGRAWSFGRKWLVIALVIIVVGGAVLAWKEHARQPEPTATRTLAGNASVLPASESASPAEGVGFGAKPIRILAGYEGQPHIDPAGNTWLGDRFFDRGGGWHGTQAFTARTNDEFLYRTYRTGEFAYSIPLSPGVYELHLFFEETAYGPGLGGGEGTRSFNVRMNGQNLLPAFDIVSDAFGANIADERIVRDVSPGKDGRLSLEFEGVVGKPIINAIEIMPGLHNKQLPIRLTTQATTFIDDAGNVWNPDNFFLGGQPSLQKPPVTGTHDPGLFARERYGHFSYALPVDVRGTYTLTLYFAEFYFGPDMAGGGGAGSRVFNVLCNGQTLLHDFDIFEEVGALHAVTKTFHHLKASPQGKLNLTFEPIANYANISAIEVIDESP